MEDRPVILVVEDDPDSAKDYKEVVEALLDVEVVPILPPVDLANLRMVIVEHNAEAVILDEVLQYHSDATYMGVDAFEYLSNTFPNLPIDILTAYPPGPELKRFPTGNLIRKRDFFDDEPYRNNCLQNLHRRMMRYRRGQEETQVQRAALRELLPATDIEVTEEFVRNLVRLHFEADDGIDQIIWIKSDVEKRICLIEVNRTALRTDELQVFRFAPSGNVPFPVFIADVRPTEWERVQSGDIRLPEGWTMEKAQVFRRPEALL